MKITDLKYSLHFNRRSLRLTLRVFPGRVMVTAPPGIRVSTIETFVASRRNWIEEKLAMFEKHPGPTTLSATAPEGFLWLFGQRVFIQIAESSSMPVLENGVLVADRIDGIDKWLDEMLFDKVLSFSSSLSGATGLVPRRIRLGNARTRWGSCSSAGVIMINRKLVHAPPNVLEYIVAHEMLHLRHKNHGRLFRADLAGLITDVSGAKKWLRLQGASLL